MAGIRFDLSSPEALERFRELVATATQPVSQSWLKEKAEELGVHRVDAENILAELGFKDEITAAIDPKRSERARLQESKVREVENDEPPKKIISKSIQKCQRCGTVFLGFSNKCPKCDVDNHPILICQSNVNLKKYVEEEKENAKLFTMDELVIIDRKTNLTWARNANITNKRMSFDEASGFIKKMNNDKFAGFEDWRIPTVNEFQAMLNYTRANGFETNVKYWLELQGFVNVSAGNYWALSATKVYYFYFYGGKRVNVESSYNSDHKLWPIRGGKGLFNLVRNNLHMAQHYILRRE